MSFVVVSPELDDGEEDSLDPESFDPASFVPESPDPFSEDEDEVVLAPVRLSVL